MTKGNRVPVYNYRIECVETDIIPLWKSYSTGFSSCVSNSLIGSVRTRQVQEVVLLKNNITSMSKTIASVFVQLAVVILPMMGVRVGSDDLTVMVQTATVIVTGLWIWFERVQKGDVSFFGARKIKYND